MDVIRLKGLRFFGYHGVFEEEKRLGQEFMVDVEILTNTQHAGQSDNLETTVDYSKVYEIVKDEVEQQRYDLLEALAEHVAERVRETFPVIHETVVRVRKPSAPLGGPMDYVEVEIRRS